MKKLQLFLRFLGIALILSSVSMPLVAGVITFHPESGLMAGNGCPDGSSRMYVDEYGDLVMEHDAMALTLPSYGQDSSLAGRQSCTIRVPITLKRGFYVTSIEQQLTFSATKSTKADAAIATRTTIMESISPLTAQLSRGTEYYGDMMITSRRDDLDTATQISQYCRHGRAEDLMLQVNLAISGRRDSLSENLIVQDLGSYIGEGIELEVAACP